MRNTIALIALGLAASLPSYAGAPAKAPAPIAPPKEEVRRAIAYDFVEAGYASILSNDAGDFYGGYLNLSWSPVNNLYVFGRIYGFGGDGSGLDFSAGVGAYVPLFNNVDWLVEGGYSYFDLDDGSESAGFVSTGFRAMVLPKLELNGNVTVTFPEAGDTSVAVGGGFVYYINTNVGVTAGYYYDLEDESHFYQAGLRYIW
ncbi:MAG: hypothetical protein JNJ83_19825 [Verrucomicrobiaceae bacterium]|nr:hypothetical protein [Verrucomicrobiaceae bacterium]